jgi:hypothetical protein
MTQSLRDKKIALEMKKARNTQGLKIGDFVQFKTGFNQGRKGMITSISKPAKDADFIGATFARIKTTDTDFRFSTEVGNLKKIKSSQIPKDQLKSIKSKKELKGFGRNADVVAENKKVFG